MYEVNGVHEVYDMCEVYVMVCFLWVRGIGLQEWVHITSIMP